MQLAYADREKYLGDRDFVEVPVAGLLDPAYLVKRSKLISLAAALKSYEAGHPSGAQKRTAAISSEVHGTTHFVAIDGRSEEQTSELPSLMRISNAVLRLKNKNNKQIRTKHDK